MAEFRLGRVKFNWTGNWTPSKSYLIDDIAKFGGNTYVVLLTTRQQRVPVTFTKTI